MMSAEGIWEDLNGTLDHVWQLLGSVVCQAFQPFFLLMTWVKHYLLFLTGCYEESKWDIQPAGWTSTTKTSHNFAETIPQPELGDLKFWITWKFLDHSWGAGTAVALPVISDVFLLSGFVWNDCLCPGSTLTWMIEPAFVWVWGSQLPLWSQQSSGPNQSSGDIWRLLDLP